MIKWETNLCVEFKKEDYILNDFGNMFSFLNIDLTYCTGKSKSCTSSAAQTNEFIKGK